MIKSPLKLLGGFIFLRKKKITLLLKVVYKLFPENGKEVFNQFPKFSKSKWKVKNKNRSEILLYNNINPYMYGQPQNYYPQQQNIRQDNTTNVNTVYLKGRPVTSLEEVRAAQIDLDGSLFIFPDINNKRIQTKQVNMDGTVSLNAYAQTELPSAEGSNYLTKQEFETVLSSLKQDLTNKFASLEKENKEDKPVFNF